jgi:peptide/nickel transport system permease protein
MSANAPETATLSQWQLIRLRFRRHRLATFSLRVLVCLYAVALGAPFFAPYTLEHRDLDYAYCPPQLLRWSWKDGWHTRAMRQHLDPVTLKNHYVADPDARVPLSLLTRGDEYTIIGKWKGSLRLFGVDKEKAQRRGLLAGPDDPLPVFHIAGADRYGRDVFSRLVYGSRISLSIGLIAIFAAFLLGVSIGGISGYIGGKVDILIQRFIEVLNSFPHIPLWLAIGAVLPQTWTSLQVYFAITLLLSLLNWTNLARVVRGKILALREEDYAVAARLMGANHGRILFRHLVPGFTSHIIVTLTLSVPGMILGETALSFLGLGLRPPIVSWGVMLQETLNLQVVANYPWMLLPVISIIITVLAFNFLGDGLRDAADPYADR